MSDRDPVASLESLKRDGLDIAKFGSCAERLKKGTKVIQMGCAHHDICPWANRPTQPVTVEGVEGEPGLRPRNLRYVIVQRGPDGRPRARQSYCSCFEWHENFKEKHGQNNTIVKVTGGEGDSVTKRGSKKIAAKEAGQEATWETVFWKEPVPVFAPSREDGVEEARVAEEIIRESGLRDEREQERQILGGDPNLADINLELTSDEIAKIVEG